MSGTVPTEFVWSGIGWATESVFVYGLFGDAAVFFACSFSLLSISFFESMTLALYGAD